jgi:hypothetical protein
MLLHVAEHIIRKVYSYENPPTRSVLCIMDEGIIRTQVKTGAKSEWSDEGVDECRCASANEELRRILKNFGVSSGIIKRGYQKTKRKQSREGKKRKSRTAKNRS